MIFFFYFLLTITEIVFPFVNFRCQKRELPAVETRRVEVTSSQSDVSTVPSPFQRTRPSREWLSETSLKLLLSEICLKLPFTLNTLYQRPTTSCTTVSLVLFTPELSELDLEKTEKTELLHKDQDSTGMPRLLQLPLLRRLCKFKKRNINENPLRKWTSCFFLTRFRLL